MHRFHPWEAREWARAHPPPSRAPSGAQDHEPDQRCRSAVPLGLWPSCVFLVLALRQDAIGGLGDGADKLSLTVWPADATSRARAGRRRTAAARWPTQAARRSRQLRRLQEQRPGRRGDRKRRSSVRLLAGEAEYVAGEADCDSLVLLAHDPKLFCKSSSMSSEKLRRKARALARTPSRVLACVSNSCSARALCASRAA